MKKYLITLSIFILFPLLLWALPDEVTINFPYLSDNSYSVNSATYTIPISGSLDWDHNEPAFEEPFPLSASSTITAQANYFNIRIGSSLDVDNLPHGGTDLTIELQHRYGYDEVILGATDWVTAGVNNPGWGGGLVNTYWNEHTRAVVRYPEAVWEYRWVQWRLKVNNANSGLTTYHTYNAVIFSATATPTTVPTATSTPTPIPTSTATSTPTQTPTATHTQTPTNTPRPTATPTATPLTTDEELHVFPGASRGGGFHGAVLAVTKAFESLPSVFGAEINDYNVKFHIGELVRINSATEFYYLSDQVGYREWIPLIPNSFKTYQFIDVDGVYSKISPASPRDTITFEAGNKIDLTVNPSTNLWSIGVNELDDTPVIEGDTTITVLGDNIYGFETTFSDNAISWNVPFPSGKMLDPNGTFHAEIWGMNWDDYSLTYGYGGIQTGLQFYLDSDYWPAGLKGKGFFQLIDSTAVLVFFVASTDAVTIPNSLMNSGLSSSVLRFQ